MKTSIIKKKLLKEYFDKLADVVDEQFPKGKCEQRGEALVLNAQANIFAEDLLNEFELKVKKISERVFTLHDANLNKSKA